MGKGAVYVALVVLAIATLILVAVVLIGLIQRHQKSARERRRVEMRRSIPWAAYSRVDDDGYVEIGVKRIAWLDGEPLTPLEGPAAVVMHRLPADADTVEVELLLAAATDRAALYNSGREGQ